MKRHFKAAWHQIIHRPRTTLLVILFLLGGSVVGLYYWTAYQLRAAQDAMKAGKYDKASTHIQRCLYFRPWSVDAHLLAARTARLKGEFAEAKALLKKCRNLQGETTEAIQLEWALLDTQQGNIEEHIVHLWEAVDNDHPESIAILATLAQVYLGQSRLLPARVCLEQWIKRDPESIFALELRGWCLTRQGDRDKATENCRQILKLSPNHAAARLALIELLLFGSLPKEALRHAEYMVQTHPDNPKGYVRLASCQYELGQLAHARETLNRVLACHPDEAEGVLLRARVEMDERNYAQAETWIREYVALSPYDPNGYELLVRCLNLQEKNEKEAAAAVQRYTTLRSDSERLSLLLSEELEKNPASPVAATEAGSLFLRLGNEPLGVHWLATALQRKPDYLPAHKAMLEHLEKTNQPGLANYHRNFLKVNGKVTDTSFSESPRNKAGH
jgi:tetratricopeptide (TPR) repeat protein